MRALERNIKGLQVWYKLPDGSKRSKRVLKILGPAAVLRIPDPNVTVSEFFRDQFMKTLEWPNMPCFWLGSWEKATYIPVEFCSMTFGHKLEEHIFNMIAQQGPGDRAAAVTTSKDMQKNRKASDVVELSKCPICQEDSFTDPVVTECGHLICWPCLARNRSIAESNRNNCPMCRQAYGSVMSINMKGEALSIFVFIWMFFF